MRIPAIQNDFSYYRRVLMREGTSANSFTDQDEDSNSNLNVANKVSLFYAEATPMLRTLSNVTSQFLNKVTIFTSIILYRVLDICIAKCKYFTRIRVKHQVSLGVSRIKLYKDIILLQLFSINFFKSPKIFSKLISLFIRI